MRQQLSSFSRDHSATAQGDTGEVVPEKAGNLQEFVEMEEMLKNPEKRRLVVSYMLFREKMIHLQSVQCINNIL